MPESSPALARTIAGARVATSVFFILFGEYKLFGPGFAHGGFQEYLHGYIDSTAVSFYRPILAGLVLPHAVFFGYLVGAVEMFIGLSLLMGIWVRAASVLGVLHMLSLTLATWWGVGHKVPLWRYFGAELDHLPLLLLFVIFYAADAGKYWGFDGWRRLGHGASVRFVMPSAAWGRWFAGDQENCRFLVAVAPRNDKPRRSEKAGFAAGLRNLENSVHYFLGAMASLVAFATRNFTTVLALI